MEFKHDKQRKAVMARIMNSGLQESRIRKNLKRDGVDSDLIDVKSEIDPTLSLPENMRHINELTSSIREKKTEIPDDTGTLLRKANELNDTRSARAKRMDSERIANHLIDGYELDKEGYLDWKKHPNRMDIRGIDA